MQIRRLARGTPLFVLAVLAGCERPPGPCAAAPDAGLRDTGASLDAPPVLATVAGTVRDTISEATVEGATVRIGRLATQSDAKGHYELTRVEPGEQELTCQKAGYATYAAALTLKSGRNDHDINLIVPVPISVATTTPYWQIADFGGSGPLLTTWSLATDPYLKYYKVQTPLAPRQPVGDQHKPGVVIYVGFSTSKTPVQMDLGENEATRSNLIHSFTHWNRIERFVYFGGSKAEGQVLAPAPGWIKAAHQNGVPILGSIFFSEHPYNVAPKDWPEAYWLSTAFKDDTTRQLLAQQLAAIAKAYGFDGYFLNQESDRDNKETNQTCGKFISELRQAGQKIGKKLMVTWYQVPAANVTPDALVASGAQNADFVFVDYGWDGKQLGYGATRALFQPYLQFSLSSVEYGVNIPEIVQYGTFADQHDEIAKINQDGVAGLFGYSAVTGSLTSLGAIDDAYSNNMDAMADLTSWYSAVSALPFLTSFNTGAGEKYFIDGAVARKQPWNDLGQQDLLPTHRLINGKKVSDFVYADAYYGGSSLQVLRDALQPTRPLYEVALPIVAGTRLEVVYKYPGAAAVAQPATVELSVDGSTPAKKLALPFSAVWAKASVDLAELAGKTVTRIAVTTASDADLLIGQLFIGSPSAPAPVTGLTMASDGSFTTLVWTGASGTFAYEVYDDQTFVGRTHQTAIVVSAPSGPAKLRVVPVSPSGQR
jgi:endo-beta-N-acetylglucosaminidase D